MLHQINTVSRINIFRKWGIFCWLCLSALVVFGCDSESREIPVEDPIVSSFSFGYIAAQVDRELLVEVGVTKGPYVERHMPRGTWVWDAHLPSGKMISIDKKTEMTQLHLSDEELEEFWVPVSGGNGSKMYLRAYSRGESGSLFKVLDESQLVEFSFLDNHGENWTEAEVRAVVASARVDVFISE
jgi:hypothetical protein